MITPKRGTRLSRRWLSLLAVPFLAFASPAHAYLHAANAAGTCGDGARGYSDAWFAAYYPTAPVNGHYGYYTTDPTVHRPSDTDVYTHVMYWSWRGHAYDGTGGRIDYICHVVGSDPGRIDGNHSYSQYAGPSFVGPITW
jgi:hypothetical protein